MEQIGVIGLGRMGSAIAQRMASQGRSVLGWTRSGRRVDGVDSVRDLGTLVEKNDTLILSLFDDEAVATVLDALLKLDLTGKQIIETSTVTPTNLTDRISRIEAQGASAVDAPISGGPELVQAGKCGIFIGGGDGAARRAQDCLTSISDRIFHVGPLGTGLVMKVINNGMLQAYFNGLADLLPMAKRAGLPLENVLRILCGGPAGIPMVTDRIPKALGQDSEVGFPLNAIFKDNEVFQKVLASYGLTSPMLIHFSKLKPAIIEAGLWDRDPAILINLAYDDGEISSDEGL